MFWSSARRAAAYAAVGAALACGPAGVAHAAYKFNFGWSPRPHFPSPLIEPAPKPHTWLFKTRYSPTLEVRQRGFEMRVVWDRADREEWNFPRILQQILRLGCEVIEPKYAQDLIDRLYATKSLVPPRDLGGERGVQILHRLTARVPGCSIALEARGGTMHTLRVTVTGTR